MTMAQLQGASLGLFLWNLSASMKALTRQMIPRTRAAVKRRVFSVSMRTPVKELGKL